VEDVEAVVDVANDKRGMILPFEPLSISFDDVSYFVDMTAVSLFELLITGEGVRPRNSCSAIYNFVTKLAKMLSYLPRGLVPLWSFGI